MILGIVLAGILAFALGWSLKDYKWVKASKTGKVMVVDGDLYTVSPVQKTHGGTVEN